MKRRDFLRQGTAAVTGSLLASGLSALPARAQGRQNVIRVLAEMAPNTVDPAGVGYNRGSINVTWNVYDRLVTFATKPLPDGTQTYDYEKIVGQAAERYEVSPDGRQVTFFLRRGAVFHDGSPVTAEDVKWSLDRAVSVPVAKGQMSTGSLTKADQFTVVDDYTVRVTTEQRDRFTLPNLAVLFPAIFNSKLARKHASENDPWATEWLKSNVAGGGPFELESHRVGQEFVLKRFDKWKNGPIASNARILYQVVPVVSNRRAAAERGDADIILDLPPRDVSDLLAQKRVRVSAVPWTSGFQFIGMNTQIKPFDDVRVRRAVAYAVPYRQLFEAVLYSRGRPLFGGAPGAPTSIEWPSPLPYDTNLEKARTLLAEAGLASGFETTFSFDIGVASLGEPIAILVQESLAKIGVKVTINKVPAGQMGTLLTNKEVPLFFEQSGAWLANPDYFFRVFYTGETRWNYGAFRNPQMDAAVKASRFEADAAKYEQQVRTMIQIARDEVPMILLWSPFLDVVLGKNIEGYTYMFHRQLEFRHLKKTAT